MVVERSGDPPFVHSPVGERRPRRDERSTERAYLIVPRAWLLRTDATDGLTAGVALQ
ncbi:MAG: hypothetical protein ABW185_18585 [Sedimenticola sp.]